MTGFLASLLAALFATLLCDLAWVVCVTVTFDSCPAESFVSAVRVEPYPAAFLPALD